MRRLAAIVLAWIALVTAVAAAGGAPLRGVALVIGEAHYEGLPALKNPPSDAAAIGGLLGRLGFAVTPVTDADHAALAAALEKFALAAKDADLALVYYSGHGLEAGGENYLVPVDADLSSPAKAGASLVSVSGWLDELAKAVPVTIVLLDACRTGAFPPGTAIVPPGAAQPVPAAEAGLAVMRGPIPVARADMAPDSLGMVIGFAASPGQPALDGAPGEANSPYATALLKHLGAGGYSFSDVMTMVAQEVYLKTKARQLPWVNSSLMRVLTFGKAEAAADEDSALIATGRRSLLLKMAATPEPERQTAETVAGAEGVPLEHIYGLLTALGVDISDPAQVDAVLTAAVKTARQVVAPDQTNLGDAVDQAVAHAKDAMAEGAYDVARDFWRKAVALGQKQLAVHGDEASRRTLAELYAALGSLDHSLLMLDDATEAYRAAIALVEPFDVGQAARYRKLLADAFAAQGEYAGDNAAFDDAVATYDAALTYYDDQPDDDVWADTANDFASVLAKYGARRDDDEYLNDAVTAYGQVLTIWTANSHPEDWARAQNNLGNAYAALGDRNHDSNRWRQAVTAYRDALSVWTEQGAPLDWARAQNNLGTMLHTIGQDEKDSDRLQGAVEAYEAALTVWTQQAAPYDWAMVQNNLGNAVTDLARLEDDAGRYRDGLDAYTAALVVWQRDRLPLLWATAQNNLGAGYATLGKMVAGKDAIAAFESGVAAYRACLEERTQERDPRNWALTQYNLGLVLSDVGMARKGADDFSAAVAAFRAALEVYSEDMTPTDWADTQEGLGWAIAQLGALGHDRGLIREGRTAMEAALRIYKDYDGAADYYADRLAEIDTLLKATK